MKTIRWLLIYFVFTACIDRIDFDAPPADYQLVVDGMITTEAGPYAVSLSKAQTLNLDLDYRLPVFGARITLITNDVVSETLSEGATGIYYTKSSTLGKIGSSYRIKIETADGKQYESENETILPPGEITSIRHEFSPGTVLQNGLEYNSDKFDILIDAEGVSGTENYMRWKSVGTYQILTFPQLRTKLNLNTGLQEPDPFPCSGFIVIGGTLAFNSECTCCNCWVTSYEKIPQVSDDDFIQGGHFKNVKIVSVPINPTTFYDKYYIEVQQMNLSKNAFTYWKLIQAQKEGATSLFQPPAAKLRSNVKCISADEEVQGYFFATSIHRKGIFMLREDVPYKLGPMDTVIRPCELVNNSTNNKPIFWK
jgi:hypothetical protein